MKYQGKSMMSLNEMAGLAIDYEGDGYVTGYPIVSGDDAYILNGVIEANEEYITINQWVPVFSESLKPVSPSLTDDQQVVLEWLKSYSYNEAVTAIDTVGKFWVTRNELGQPNNWRLNHKQQAQVLQVFSQWAQEQEEE